MVKSFKAAFKAKQIMMIHFIIDELDMPLNHEAFDGFLYNFIFNCHLAERANDDVKKDFNRLICEFIVQGLGKGNCDQIERPSGSTPLILACELLFDISIIKTLVDQGGSNINAVDCKDGMPLNIMKARLKADPENYDLQEIYEYLKKEGAVRDWRKLTKKNNW
jgi:hypothetical protein